MARLVFAVLCEDTTVRNDQTIDMFNAFVWMGVAKGALVSNSSDSGDSKALFNVVTSWIRSDVNEPENFKMRLRILDPNGTSLLHDFEGDGSLIKTPQSIFVTKLLVLPPLSIQGAYEVEIALKQTSRWKTVHRCPLMIEFVEPDQIQDAGGETIPNAEALPKAETLRK